MSSEVETTDLNDLHQSVTNDEDSTLLDFAVQLSHFVSRTKTATGTENYQKMRYISTIHQSR